MSESAIPQPEAMPVDTASYIEDLRIIDFINSYYQWRDVKSIRGVKTVLIVGPGRGLTTTVLQWKDYDVKTLDIDPGFHPDFVGSVTDMSMFRDAQFDVVIASHVLEHFSYVHLDTALAEIARVGVNALIYLPVYGRKAQFRLITTGFGEHDVSFIGAVGKPWVKPDPKRAWLQGGEHFWEVGMRGFKLADMNRRFEKYFQIVSSYRNKDWNYSHNWVVRSKRHIASS